MAPLSQHETPLPRQASSVDRAHDARNRGAAIEAASKSGDDIDRPYDAFLFYSNDEVWLEALKFNEDFAQKGSHITTTREPIEQQGPKRKKYRISDERHPYLALEGMIKEFDGDEDGNFEGIILDPSEQERGLRRKKYRISDELHPYLALEDMMKELDGHEGDDFEGIDLDPSGQQGLGRKTRISFELHPYLALEDAMKEFYDDEEDDDFKDIEFELSMDHTKSKGILSARDIFLAELLRM